MGEGKVGGPSGGTRRKTFSRNGFPGNRTSGGYEKKGLFSGTQTFLHHGSRGTEVLVGQWAVQGWREAD